MNNEIVATTTVACYRNITDKYVVVQNPVKDIVSRPDIFRRVDCN